MALFDLATVVAILIAASALLVSLVEKALAHRRTYAALVATGTPRSVLARVAVWQVATPVLPALVIALAIGAGYLRLVTGTHVTIRRLAFRGLDLSLDPGEDLPHHGRLAQPGRARQPQERNRRVHRASIGRHRSRQRPVLHAPRVGRFSFGPRQRRAL
jgi:hypothetical protein